MEDEIDFGGILKKIVLPIVAGAVVVCLVLLLGFDFLPQLDKSVVVPSLMAFYFKVTMLVLFYLFVFARVKPTLQQFRWQCSWLIILLLAISKVLYTWSRQTQATLPIALIDVGYILLLLLFLLLSSLYFLVHFGFINQQTDRPLSVRCLGNPDSSKVNVFVIVLGWMTTNGLFKHTNEMSDGVMISFCVFILIFPLIFSMRTVWDKHRLAYDHYFKDFVSAEQKAEMEDEIPPIKLVKKDSTIDDNIAKYKAKKKAEALARANKPWWQLW